MGLDALFKALLLTWTVARMVGSFGWTKLGLAPPPSRRDPDQEPPTNQTSLISGSKDSHPLDKLEAYPRSN